MSNRAQLELAGAATFVTLVPVGLLLASFGPQDNAIVTILGSLRLHLALTILVLAGILFAINQWLRGFVSLVIASGVLAHMVVMLAPHTAPNEAIADGIKLEVLDFNILGGNFGNGERIADFILSTTADVAFIQEALPLRAFLDRLEKDYPFRIGCGVIVRRCDSMLLSRHPLAEPDFFMPGDHGAYPQRLFTTAITIGGNRINLAAIHLSKPDQSVLQAAEYREAAAHIAGLNGPVIASGDFNTAPWSPRFVDFLGTSGLGRAVIEPATWPGGRGELNHFGLPIDHILIRGGAIADLENLPSNFGSNHRGLAARLSFPARD